MAAGHRRTKASGSRKQTDKTNPAPHTATHSHDSRVVQHSALLTVIVVTLLIALVRLRVADVPLERDEGEYAYAGQLILQGISPFELAYNMKFPGSYYAYALMMAVFGQTAWGIHVGVLVVNVLTIAILFVIARKVLKDSMAAAVTAITFGLLSLDRWTLAIAGHATHFVVLAAMAGLLLIIRAIESGRARWFAAAGFLLGVSVLMKQNGALFLAFGVAVAALSAIRLTERRVGHALLRASLVGAGALVPIAGLFGWLYSKGVFGKFWFWTMEYGSQYAADVPFDEAWSQLQENFTALSHANLPIWLLAGAGVLLLFITRWPAALRIGVTAFLAVSMLAVTPGFYFRQHYFILLMPAAALFCGVAVHSMSRVFGRFTSDRMARLAAAAVFLIPTGLYASREWNYLVSISPDELSRTMYGGNPFVESPEIATYLQAHTDPSDRIAVLGSEPQLFFYANRKSATGYVYTYALMEQHKYSAKMQEEMIAEITAAQPKYLVFVAVTSSWLTRDPEERILMWADNYMRKCYNMVGIADIGETHTEWRWDDQVRSYRPKSPNVVFILKRTSGTSCSAP